MDRDSMRCLKARKKRAFPWAFRLTKIIFSLVVLHDLGKDQKQSTMRNFVILALAVLLGACMGKEKKEMVNEYEDLMIRHEKSDQYHKLIYQKDKELIAHHEELMKFFSEEENIPDSIMEGMQRHEAFFAEHREMLARHKAIMDEHEAYKDGFKKRKVKKDALRDKLDEMTAEHEAMDADHEYVKDKLVQIRSEHNQYRKWYNEVLAKR
jgi:hypothetical protein